MPRQYFDNLLPAQDNNKKFIKQLWHEIEDTNYNQHQKYLPQSDKYVLRNLHVYESHRSKWCKPDSEDAYDPHKVLEPGNFQGRDSHILNGNVQP